MPTGTVLVTGGSGYLVCVVQAACLLVVCRVLESVICSLRGCRAAGAVPGGGLVSRRIQGGLHALLQRRAGAGGRRHSTPGGPGLRRWAGRVPARPGAAARRGELRGGVLARGLRARPCGGTVRASRPLSAADGSRAAHETGANPARPGGSAVNVPDTLLAALEEHAAGAGGRPLLIQLSSDQVYAGTKAWWAEEDACAPVNAYGRTKAEAEAAIQVAARCRQRPGTPLHALCC